MMLSFNNEDVGLEGEHQYQEQRTIQNRPQTVSSLSSIDTTGYEPSDGTYDPNNIQQSALPPLPPLTENSGASTIVSAHTSADTNFGLTTNNVTFISGTASVGALEHLPSVTSSTSLSAPPTMQITSSTGVLVASTPNTNTVPEFLYQLTKMLTDNNRDIIEWSNGKFWYEQGDRHMDIAGLFSLLLLRFLHLHPRSFRIVKLRLHRFLIT